MPHSTEFPYFVPRSTAPRVHRGNLREETHREDDLLKNFYLQMVSLERGLTYWINPEGVRVVHRLTGPSFPDPVVYWYPRDKAVEALAEMDANNTDIVAYKLIAEGIEAFREFARNDTERSKQRAFGPKQPVR